MINYTMVFVCDLKTITHFEEQNTCKRSQADTDLSLTNRYRVTEDESPSHLTKNELVNLV